MFAFRLIVALAVLAFPAVADAQVTAAVQDGELVVTGTVDADWIEVADDVPDGQVVVYGAQSAGTGCTAGPTSMTCTGVERIRAELGPGDDTLAQRDGTEPAPLATMLPVTGNGEGGADRLFGGSGPDRLLARDGTRDELVCGDGADLLVGDFGEPSRDCETVAPAVLPVVVTPAAPTVGSRLFADGGGVDGTPQPAIGWQWLRCDAAGAGCVALTGATDRAFVAGTGEVGSTLRVQYAAVNAGGRDEFLSAPSGVIGPAPAPPRILLPSPVDRLAAKVLAVARPKVRRGANGFAVDTGIRATCRLGGGVCTIAVTARTAKTKGRRTIVAATARTIVGPGRSARLRFRLRKDGAARIRRDKRLKLVLSVRATQPSGRTVTQQMPLTLRAPR